MASIFRKLFRRKKQPPLVCAVSLDDSGHPVGEDPNHVHTSACFIEFDSLALVELFQSQGCASCPPAVPAIQEATIHPNLLLLSWNVGLFNHTGWQDTYSNATNDQRHKDYARKWTRNSLFTPQIVVNGISDGSGAEGKEEVHKIIARARELQKSRGWNMYVDANDTDVRIDTDLQEAAPHDVFMILYDNEDQVVKIGKGANKGKKLNHRNTVKQITKIGVWQGGNLTLPLPIARSAMNTKTGAAVIVQAGPGGPIEAVARL